MEDLLESAMSGKLLALDISDTVLDEHGKQKQTFVDNLCALIRKSRKLARLNISKLAIRVEAQQNYLFFAFQLSSSKTTIQSIDWNGDFTKPYVTAKFCSVCLENLASLKFLSVLPKEMQTAEMTTESGGLDPPLTEVSLDDDH